MLFNTSIFRHPAYTSVFHDPDPSPAPNPAPDPNPNPNPDPDPNPAPEFKAPTSQAEFDAMVKARIASVERATERKFKDSLPDLEKSIRDKITQEAAADTLKEQGKFKELYEKSEAEKLDLQKKLDDVAKTSTEEQLAAMRKAAGTKYGLPESVSTLLAGDDEASINAKAEAIAKDMKIEPPSTEAGSGGPSRKAAKPAQRTHRFGTGVKIVSFPGAEPAKQEG